MKRQMTWRPALAGLAALIALALVFSFPPVQVAAQNFLDLFRVKHFAAVTFDRSRLERLQSGNVDFEALVGDSVEVLDPTDAPQYFDNAQAAGKAAGFTVLSPSWLPDTVSAAPNFNVTDAGAARYTVDTELVNGALEMLEITDVSVPAALNGAQVTMRIPAMVSQEFYSKSGVDRWTYIAVMQSRSPEVDLPPGTSMADLGVIGLRIAGMAPDEARKFAATIDWNTTLVIPVPANVVEFKDVSVRGTTGLLLTGAGRGSGSDTTVLLMWSENDQVFAVSAPDADTAMQIAESLR